jgi:hypothetical protein
MKDNPNELEFENKSKMISILDESTKKILLQEIKNIF